MAHRADDIRQDIEDAQHDIDNTRSAMTEKLEMLEDRVRETVEGAQSSVEEIVENVKEMVDMTFDAVRARFSRKGLLMPTHTKTVFLGILSLAGLLALPPLAVARDSDWQHHEEREHRSKEELSTRDRRSFEAYLDAHWQTAQLLYQQPELIN